MSNKLLSLQPLGSSFVLLQCSIQLVNQTHEFYGVKFFTDLFGKGVPTRSLRSHKRDSPLLLITVSPAPTDCLSNSAH
jgi:hypothetical protein